MRIGIDLGGTKIEGALLKHDHSIAVRQRLKTPQTRGYAAILESVTTLVNQLEHTAGTPCSLGLAAPGAVDASGRVKNSNTQCLIGEALGDDLRAQLSRAVRIENDANCFALAEALYGAGQFSPTVFGVIMGTGVGGGLVIDGRLHTGLHHIAGEWGHNVLESDGPPCYCGKRGCIETFLSGPGFLADYQRLGGSEARSPEQIIALSRSGESFAVRAVDQLLDRLGRALAQVINVFDPHTIVLGGGLSNIDELYEQGPAHIAKYVFNSELKTPIKRNRNGDSAGVLGAARLWDN